MTREPVVSIFKGCLHAWTDPLYTIGGTHFADVCIHCSRVMLLSQQVETPCSWCGDAFTQEKKPRMRKTCSDDCWHHVPEKKKGVVAA
jgi:hypothetical protein